MTANLARSHFGSLKRASVEVTEAAGARSKGLDEGDASSTVRRLRSHERYSVNIKALLYLRDRFQTTTIRDVSIGGARLEGAYAVVPGDGIVLQLNNGRKLSAVVKWWICGRCGIAFDSPLMANDPILIEGATGRSSHGLMKERLTRKLS